MLRWGVFVLLFAESILAMKLHAGKVVCHAQVQALRCTETPPDLRYARFQAQGRKRHIEAHKIGSGQHMSTCQIPELGKG